MDYMKWTGKTVFLLKKEMFRSIMKDNKVLSYLCLINNF